MFELTVRFISNTFFLPLTVEGQCVLGRDILLINPSRKYRQGLERWLISSEAAVHLLLVVSTERGSGHPVPPYPELSALDNQLARENQCFQWNVSGYTSHTLGCASCTGVVGQHKTNSMVFLWAFRYILLFGHLFYFVFCLFVLIFILHFLHLFCFCFLLFCFEKCV